MKRLLGVALWLVVGHAAAQDSMWLCAASAADIPPGYYPAQLAYPYEMCAWNQHYVSVIRIKDQAGFWQWNFYDMGAPAGYVITTVGKVEFAGCRKVGQNASGHGQCQDRVGWPKIYVKKLP